MISSFNSVTNADGSTEYESNEFTISGIDTELNISNKNSSLPY
jgi:hypothetical protein